MKALVTGGAGFIGQLSLLKTPSALA